MLLQVSKEPTPVAHLHQGPDATFGGALAACGGGGGGGGGSQAAFCDTLKKDAAEFEKLNNNADFTDQATIETVGKVVDDLAKKAPAEIKQDMLTINDAVKQLISVMPDLTKAIQSGDFAKAESIGSEFSDKAGDLDKASKNVEKFAKDKCGVDLSSGTSSDSTSAGLSDLSSLSDFSDLGNAASELSKLSSEFSDLSLSDLSSS